MFRGSRTLSLALLCAVPLALGTSSAAQAKGAFGAVAAEFVVHNQVINPCKFTPAQLNEAKNTIPNDYAQYAPDFKDAIDAALKARASGVCDKKKSGTKKQAVPVAPTGSQTPPSQPQQSASTGKSTASTPATTAANTVASVPTPQPTPSVTPAPAVADGAILAAARSTGSDNGVPAPLVGLAIVAALAALAAFAVTTSRWLAFEPRWLVRSRHATAEAGWRTSAAWAEFRDWLRLGR